MNQYYSEELSQKTKRGLRETRIKGNYMGGRINYGYKVVHETMGGQTVAKVVINEDEAPILLHIFEAYAAGNRIPDIVRELDDRGIRNRGNPFTVNSIYFMLQQEKYTGVYNFNGETFTHIYPAIIPKELYQIVRKRVDANKTGKHVIGVDYILMGKCFCGYCGKQLRSAAGTTTDGTILRYYRCPYSKKDVNCHNKSVRKEVLEEIVVNTLTEELTKPDNLKFLTDKVFELYCARTQDDSDLHRYEKELAATDKAIKNILAAIEEGIVTGGGVAYIRAQEALEGLKGDNADEQTGISIIRRAIEEPLRQICRNAGVEGAVIVNKVREGKGNFGYNAKDETFGDLRAAGVVDPAKVTRVALENAASVAGMFLTTECVICDKKEEKADAAMGGAAGMGGMGGMM